MKPFFDAHEVDADENSKDRFFLMAGVSLTSCAASDKMLMVLENSCAASADVAPAGTNAKLDVEPALIASWIEPSSK